MSASTSTGILKSTTTTLMLPNTDLTATSAMEAILFEVTTASGDTADNAGMYFNASEPTEFTCTTCKDLVAEALLGSGSDAAAPFCTCTDDPYKSVDVLKEVPELRVTLVTYLICIVLGAGGNLVTLFTMATADRKNKSGTNIFLISLSIADLLLLFLAAPMELVQYLAREFVNSSACKIAEYSRVLSGVASILNLLAVTTERFIVIVFPMRSRSLCTMTNCRRSLIVVWALSLLLASPVLWTKSVYSLNYGNNETLLTVSYCNDFDDQLGYVFTIYQLVVCFAMPGLIMIIGYSVVIRVLWKSNKNMSMLTNTNFARTGARFSMKAKSEAGGVTGSGSAVSRHNSTDIRTPMLSSKKIQTQQNHQRTDDVKAARKQVIKMLICVVILFLLCWGPRFIMELLMKMQFSWLYYEHVYWTRVILFLLPVVHAIFNPVVYFVMSRNFRTSLVKKLTTCPPCENGANPRGSFEELNSRNMPMTRRLNQNKMLDTTVIVESTRHGVIGSNPEGGLVGINGDLCNGESPAASHPMVIVHANGELTLGHEALSATS